ncbi:hypothetical protein OF83DRAFT_1134627, partial [Amylostereum chailletii]
MEGRYGRYPHLRWSFLCCCDDVYRRDFSLTTRKSPLTSDPRTSRGRPRKHIRGQRRRHRTHRSIHIRRRFALNQLPLDQLPPLLPHLRSGRHARLTTVALLPPEHRATCLSQPTRPRSDVFLPWCGHIWRRRSGGLHAPQAPPSFRRPSLHCRPCKIRIYGPQCRGLRQPGCGHPRRSRIWTPHLHRHARRQVRRCRGYDGRSSVTEQSREWAQNGQGYYPMDDGRWTPGRTTTTSRPRTSRRSSAPFRTWCDLCRRRGRVEEATAVVQTLLFDGAMVGHEAPRVLRVCAGRVKSGPIPPWQMARAESCLRVLLLLT